MKYPRNVKIFRGQLDFAPLASVFFLTLIFVVLQSSLVYSPGIKVEMAEANDLAASFNPRRFVEIDEEGLFHFEKKVLKESAFQAVLLDEIKKSKALGALIVRNETSGHSDLLMRLRNFAQELGVVVVTTTWRLDLPEGDSLPGVAHETVTVAASMNGQLYYQNQIITPERLALKLQEAVREAKEPLTLVIQADKGVTYDLIMSLAKMARRSGIGEVTFATRPKVLPLPPERKGGQ